MSHVVTSAQVSALYALTGRDSRNLTIEHSPTGHLNVQRGERVWTISREGATARLLPVRGTATTEPGTAA